MYSSILIPTDGSALAARAVSAGITLAKALGARLTVVMASEPFHVFGLVPEQLDYSQSTYSRQVEAAGQQVLGTIAQQAAAAGVLCHTVLREHDHPHEAIIETARANACDLIMMASHGRRGMAALLLGSVTAKVLTHSDIPVLVYR